MTQNERSEIREMIRGILAGWQEATAEREKLIYLSLNNIDSHLEKLNGKVSSHEKTILENLPHNISHCPQAPVIKEIHDAMIENIGIEKGSEKGSTKRQVKLNNIISIIGTVLVVIGLVISVLYGKKGDEKLNSKIDNFGTPVILNSRGEIDKLPAGDSLKFFRNGEFKSTYKDTIK